MKFTKLCALLSAVLLCTTCVDRVVGDTFGNGANTFDIEFVDIGNPGNPADTTGAPNPAGAVAEAYRIGKFEISEQMIDKANALGALGITKDTRSADKPATSVSWLEAAKFVNWLNTSTDSTPAYKFDGGGTFQLWTPGDAGYNPNNLYRNTLAKYFLPSVHEWYKAAFYDPTSGGYYNYPTGSDSVPDGIDFPGDTIFDTVYPQGGANSQPNDINNVGVLSPYGTAGQSGNVWELNETEYDLVNDSTSSSTGLVIPGGGWENDFCACFDAGGSTPLPYVLSPTTEIIIMGFRVASNAIPEPSSLLLGTIASVGLLLRRRR